MDVIFAVLPFADLERPAIGVSLLKAGLARRGISSGVRYLNWDLAQRTGVELYQWIAHCWDAVNTLAVSSLIGEWFFAEYVFGDKIPGVAEYVAAQLPDLEAGRLATLLSARAMLPTLVDSWAEQIRRERPRIVGFTTSFDQTCACLAVAKGLKSLPHPPLIVFGGSNCLGEMGKQMLEAFPWIDYVCTSEGDEAVPEWTEKVLSGNNCENVAGMLGRHLSDDTAPGPIWKMDSLPEPDYTDYAERICTTDLAITPRLLIETARGCWWGAKQHCIFCGLNGQTMNFRSKSPERVVSELDNLRRRYGIRRIEAVDNILDLRYFQTVFPELAQRRLDVELFYETKSNLTYEQVSLLKAARVATIQPGIESFCDASLRRMKKGCTGLQNLQLLRWCEENDISVTWNILYGLPGEGTDEVEWMADLLPLLMHLPAPTCCEAVRMDRYSPLFAQASRFAISAPRAAPAYRYVYPLDGTELRRLAYFFDFEHPQGKPRERAHRLIAAAQLWIALGQGRRPKLDLFQAGSLAIVNDTRPCAIKPTHILCGTQAKVYISCDTAQKLKTLKDCVDAPRSEIVAAAAALVEAKLMVQVGDRYLSLAVFRNRSV